jgi:membrane protease YdiL (CAAX protease family)
MSSNKRSARAAGVLGALAVLAIPLAALAPKVSSVSLLHALYAGVPVAAVLALLAVYASRRARFLAARSVDPQSAGPVRTARLFAWAGLYAGITGGLALGVYAALVWAQ